MLWGYCRRWGKGTHNYRWSHRLNMIASTDHTADKCSCKLCDNIGNAIEHGDIGSPSKQ